MYCIHKLGATSSAQCLHAAVAHMRVDITLNVWPTLACKCKHRKSQRDANAWDSAPFSNSGAYLVKAPMFADEFVRGCDAQSFHGSGDVVTSHQ